MKEEKVLFDWNNHYFHPSNETHVEVGWYSIQTESTLSVGEIEEKDLRGENVKKRWYSHFKKNLKMKQERIIWEVEENLKEEGIYKEKAFRVFQEGLLLGF